MADAASQEASTQAYVSRDEAAAVVGGDYGEYYGEYADAVTGYAPQEGYEGTQAEGEGYDYQENYDGEWQGADDAYAGYTYDPPSGEYVYTGAAAAVEEAANGGGGAEGSYFALDDADPIAPPSVFGDEAYWQQYGDDAASTLAADMYATLNGGAVEEAIGAQEIPPGPEEGDVAITSVTPVAASTPADSTTVTSTSPTSSQWKHNKRKSKGKQERMQMRQMQLEKEEAEKHTTPPETEIAAGPTAPGRALTEQTSRRLETRPLTFLERERAKVRLRMRKLRAIRRKRMPLQVRILTATRTHLSPLETYFGGGVEAALSDIFWASKKGDFRRVRFLVEVEQVSVADSTLDPWHMEQTPLHWAAKGGDAAVISYLLQAGASPRILDETGSLPLHLACWAGHVDATLALLRATDTKDLYVRDYDAALAPLDWAQLRGHTALVAAIESYEDAKWLPKFVDDLVRGIVRYKIKLYKEPPKSPTRGIQFRRAAGGEKSPHPDNETAGETATA